MRQIVSEDKSQQDAEIRKIKSIIGPINRILLQFKTDTGYDGLTMGEIIMLIFGTNNDSVYTLIEKVNVVLDKQISSLNLSNLVTGNLKKGADVYVKKLAADLSKMAVQPGAGHIHNLALEVGQLILPSETEESIRESFRLVITNGSSKKMFDLQATAAKALSEFFNYVKDETIIHYTMPHQMVAQCFELDQDAKNIIPILMDYDRVCAKTQQTAKYNPQTATV